TLARNAAAASAGLTHTGISPGAVAFVGAGLVGAVLAGGVLAGMSASFLLLSCSRFSSPANFRIAFGASLFGESGLSRLPSLACHRYRFLLGLVDRFLDFRMARMVPRARPTM
ncbi:MAG: hypothetical protein QOD10_1041, partial [Mycobacterium sp.]|nr:hypothetical protein [Mycobacterium sp.]